MRSRRASMTGLVMAATLAVTSCGDDGDEAADTTVADDAASAPATVGDDAADAANADDASDPTSGSEPPPATQAEPTDDATASVATEAPPADDAPTTDAAVETTPATEAPPVSEAAPAGAQVGGREFAEAVEPAAAFDGNPFPDLVVDDIRRGTKANLANILPSDRPVLLWAWAPH